MSSFIDDIPNYQCKELISKVQKLSLGERADNFFALMEFARDMQREGIKLRNPTFTHDQIDAEFKRMMYDFYARQSKNDR